MRRIALIVLGVAMSTVCGCGDSLPYGLVSGKVTYQGEPVAAGTRVFFQQGGVIAAGVVDESGNYSLNYKGSPKIRPGDYDVFIGPPRSNMGEKEYKAFKKKVEADYRKQGKKPPPFPDWVLPEKYYKSETSQINETVETGENVFDLNLED